MRRRFAKGLLVGLSVVLVAFGIVGLMVKPALAEDNAKTDISSCTIELSASTFAYDGTERKPTVTVKYGDATLTQDTNYTVTYPEDAKNAGEKTITVAGKGNSYTGSTTVTYTITAKAITGVTVTGLANVVFTGSAFTPTVTVKDGTTILTKDTDFSVAYANNTNVGTATVTIAGKGNYTGSVEKTFTISAKALTDSMLTAPSDVTYNGSAQTPEPTLKDGTITLTKDKDYTVTYTDNTNAGTASFKVVGTGNYTGELTGTFTIKPAPIVVVPDDASKTEGDADPKLTYTITGLMGTDTRDSVASATLKRDAGESVGTYPITVASVTVKNSNYTNDSGSNKTGTFTITAKPATTYTITYNANGGEGSMASQTVEQGGSVTLSANAFTRSGHGFTGWNTAADGSGTSYGNGASVTPSSNLTLYAQWAVPVTKNPEMTTSTGGKYISQSTPVTYTIKQVVADDATSMKIWFDLESVMSYTTTAEQVTVQTSDGGEVSGAVVTIDGQRLTVEVADAAPLQGKTVQVAFTAKVNSNANLKPYLNDKGTTASIPYQAHTEFKGLTTRTVDSKKEYIKITTGSNSSNTSKASRTSTASTTKKNSSLAKTADPLSFSAVAILAGAGVTAVLAGRRQRR